MPHSSDILLDGFNRSHTYLRIAVTERCNLRCTYCMPADGVELRPRDEMLTFEEIVRLARLFVSEGISKIRLTGGEPLVRKDIEDLTQRLSSIEGVEALAITTNGLLLPGKLEALKTAGITHYNISLDTLHPDKFRDITLRGGLETVLESIELSVAAGYSPVKINCVVQRGVNEDELIDFVAWTEKMPIEVRFIEYMPFGGNEWDESLFFSYAEMLTLIKKSYPTLRRSQDSPNDTSKAYDVPGHLGRLGFISSMSDDFCSSCNRLRITADGNLKVCLFGSGEINLRDAIRNGATDDMLRPLISSAVSRKKASHDGMYEISRSDNRPMILIGG